MNWRRLFWLGEYGTELPLNCRVLKLSLLRRFQLLSFLHCVGRQYNESLLRCT